MRDVLGAADRRVVGHPFDVVAEPLGDLGQVVRVLEVGVRERGEDVVVQRAQRRGSFTSKPYWPLKSIVSTAPVAATSSTSAGAQLASASSLKRTPGERASRRRTGSIDGSLPRPSELTKRTGFGSSPHVVQRAASLAEREVEGRRLERPATEAQRHVPLRRLRPQRETTEALAEAGQRPLAGERQRRPGLVQRGAVLAERRDVLAQPLRSGADEPHVRRDAVELEGEDGVQAVVLARLDDERKLRDPRPQPFPVHRWARGIHPRHCSIGLAVGRQCGRPRRARSRAARREQDVQQ